MHSVELTHDCTAFWRLSTTSITCFVDSTSLTCQPSAPPMRAFYTYPSEVTVREFDPRSRRYIAFPMIHASGSIPHAVTPFRFATKTQFSANTLCAKSLPVTSFRRTAPVAALRR